MSATPAGHSVTIPASAGIGEKTPAKGARAHVDAALAGAGSRKNGLSPTEDVMVEIGTCGNFHIIAIVARIRDDIGYYIDQRRRFPDNALLAQEESDWNTESIPHIVPLGHIIELYEAVDEFVTAKEQAYRDAGNDDIDEEGGDPSEIKEIREGLWNLAQIGWIIGEVRLGNMGVTGVFEIFEKTGFHKDLLTNQLYRILLELTLHALERPDARQFKTAKEVSEWGVGCDFSPDPDCRRLRTRMLGRIAEIESDPDGIPDKRAKARTGVNRKGN